MIRNFTFVKIQKFANFVLLFSIILDPTNQIFGLKDLAFIFFVFVSINIADFKYIFIVICFLLIYFFSFLSSFIFNVDIDETIAIAILKSILFLIYIFWVTKPMLKSFQIFYSICIIMALIEILVYFCIVLFPVLEYPIYSYMQMHGKTIKIGFRDFYGFRVLMTWYQTSPILVIPLSISFSNFLKKRKKMDLLNSLIFVLGLLCSGTRANMLSCILLIFLVFINYIFFEKKWRTLSLLLLLVVCISTLVIVFFLLTAKEYSTNVKIGHFYSYLEFFFNNPNLFLFWGGGPGTIIYSTGKNEFTSLTELSYMDLLKNFGLIQSLLIIGIFCIPIIKIFYHHRYTKYNKFCLIIGYIAYLFIAGTNPLLISSTGLTVFIIVLYISEHYIFDEIQNKKQFFTNFFRKGIKYD